MRLMGRREERIKVGGRTLLITSFLPLSSILFNACRHFSACSAVSIMTMPYLRVPGTFVFAMIFVFRTLPCRLNSSCSSAAFVSWPMFDTHKLRVGIEPDFLSANVAKGSSGYGQDHHRVIANETGHRDGSSSVIA